MTLSLKGHFSYINKYNKLIFTYVDDESRQKLERLYKGDAGDYDNILSRRPFDSSSFTVTMPKANKCITEDINTLIGIECIVHVKPAYYNFISKNERNAGERVRGMTLTLVDIKRGGNYVPFSN